jgi:hypothetical protein
MYVYMCVRIYSRMYAVFLCMYEREQELEQKLYVYICMGNQPLLCIHIYMCVCVRMLLCMCMYERERK